MSAEARAADREEKYTEEIHPERAGRLASLISNPEHGAQVCRYCQHCSSFLIMNYCRLEHPNKLLHSIFELLYNEDVITEEAFCNWETNKDPAEQVRAVYCGFYTI